MRIAKITGDLSNKDFTFSNAEWEFVKETKQFYVIKSPQTTKHLEKDELNKVF